MMLFLFVALFIFGVMGKTYTDGAVFRENFEDDDDMDSFWKNHKDLKIVQDPANKADSVVETRYRPSKKGSDRTQDRFPFSTQLTTATLTFDVKFKKGFEWVRGGKMHGLYGGTATSGCRPKTKKGWTVRMMWRSSGEPTLYIYHQDRKERCGDSWGRDKPAMIFKHDIWYRIQIYVKLNSAPNKFDGEARLYVDGVQRVVAPNLRLTGDTGVKIDGFVFVTFYGGASRKWSPSKNTYTYFDNFSVREGKRISDGNDKQCELEKSGIYRFGGSNVCCADECGSCGGKGCGSLPGGKSECCITPIKTSGDSCKAQDAPCVF